MASGVRHLPGRAVRALRVLASLGPTTAGAVVANTVRAELMERRAAPPIAHGTRPRTPGALVSAEPIAESRSDRAGRRRKVPVGAAVRFVEAELEVRFLADDLVRISWGPDTEPIGWARPASAGGVLADVAPGRPDGGAPDGAGAHGLVPARAVRLTGDPAEGFEVRAASLAVRVRPDGSLEYLDASGAVLRRELPPLRRGAARVQRLVLRPGERLAGLGEQAGDVILGGTHRLWNRDPGGGWGPGTDPLYWVVPVMVGMHPHGDVLSFWENTHEGDVRIVTPASVGEARVETTFLGGMLRQYVATGGLDRLAERYGELTGRPPLPPRWALGYHQSRWGYRNEADVREVSEGFAAEDLPLSVVHLDIDYMDGNRVFTVDRGRFPSLDALTRDLAGRGTRLVTIVDPAVKADPGYDVYATGRAGGRFVRGDDGEPLLGTVWPGAAAFPDFTDPAAREWWSGWYRRLVDEGVAGVWHDMNEPTSISLWGDRTLPRNARHAAEGRGGDHRECHNAYGLLMDHAGAAALAALRPERRPFVLSRAGWAGAQRWAWNWTGDSETSWDGLAQQVPTAIGLGLSGVAFCGSDTGGFTGEPSGELYVRWLELSALMPLCRTHSIRSAPGREPWRFAEPYRGAIGALVRFRYRLLPYLYTLAEEAARIGHPLVRPPWWPGPGAGPGDAGTFLLGGSLLCAPVLADGARTRRVALPPGGWFEWRPLQAAAPAPAVADAAVALQPVEGEAVLDAPLGAAPILVRAGSVLPLDDGSGDVGLDHAPRRLAFHCFPDRAGRASGTCFDDAGDGYGPWRRDRLDLVPGAGGLRTLRWLREGSWPPPGRVRVVVHGKAAVLASADGRPVDHEVFRHDKGAATVVECTPFEVLELS